MGRIPVYQSEAPAPRPDNSLPEAFARGGEVIGEEGRRVGNEFQDLQNKGEMADLTANMAQTKADLEIEWQKRLRETDPSDPKFKTLAQDFYNDVANPAIEKAGSGFMTNEANFASRQMTSILSADVRKSAVADQATEQGQYASTRLLQVNHQLAQMVFNDPSQFDTALTLSTAMLKGAIHDMGLPAEMEIKLQYQFGHDLALSTLQGAAVRDANPEKIKAMVADPKYAQYLSKSEMYTIVVDSERQFSLQRAEGRAGLSDEKQTAIENYNSGVNGLIAKSFDPAKGTFNVTADTFRDLAALGSSDAVRKGLVPPALLKSNIDFFISMEKHDHDVPTDPHVYEDFRKRLAAGTLTDQDVITAQGQNLSDHDAMKFRSDIAALAKDPQRRDAEKQFSKFLVDMKPIFTSTGMLGMKDPEGQKRWDAFQRDANESFERTYQSGGDWQGLLNHTNKAYLGNWASKYSSNQKGASIPNSSDDLYGTQKDGFTFIGHTRDEWNIQSKWRKD
jgi:hypothetical protein